MAATRPLVLALAAGAVFLAWTCGGDDSPTATGHGSSAGPRPPKGADPERRPPFFRLNPLQIASEPASLSLEATYDTQPGLAHLGRNPWCVWVGHDFGARDRIWAARLESGEWTAPEPVTRTDGQYFRPVLAPVVEGQGSRARSGLACAWTATGSDSNPDSASDPGSAHGTAVWYATNFGDGWSDPVRLSPEGGHHQNVELAASPGGELFAVWQTAVPGGFELNLAHRSAGSLEFHGPRQVTPAAGAYWDPALACAPDGSVGLVWSAFEAGDYDLQFTRLAEGEFAPVRSLTGSGAYDMHPDIAADARGRFWISWDRMSLEHHASSGLIEPSPEAGGAPINIGINARGKVELGVLCVDGDELLRTEMRAPGPPRTHRIENAGYPRIAVDAGGAPWVAYRAWGVKLKAPHSYWWDTVVMRASADGWSRPEVLARSDGNLEEPDLVTVGERAFVVAAMEHRATTMPGNPHPEDGPRSYTFDHHWNIAPQGDSGEVYATELRAEVSGPPPLRPALPFEPTSGDDWVGREAARHSIEVEGPGGPETFQLLFGDTHRHSNISRCTAGSDATVEDHHRYARDVMRLDFVVVSDHSGQTSDFNWWTLCKAAELYHVPGELVTLFGYEISNSYPTGHKNLVFPERPSTPLRLALDSVSSGPAIWERLAADGVRAITIPHTPAMPAGTDWEDYDPRYERLVEIFQARTGSSEHAGAPRLAASSTNELGFVHRALDKGYRMGFIASTDHGHGVSYACVYARDSSREAIFEALHAKRCYGSTSYGTVLDVRAEGRPMGSELSADGPVEITIEARAPTPLARAVLFEGSTAVETFELEGNACSVQWTAAPKPGDRSYYVRLELKNGELAWSSPIWLTD